MPPSSTDALDGRTPSALSIDAPLTSGRMGVYAAVGASLAALPLPLVPGVLGRRVRGALVHDVAVRRGLSLSPEAREVLTAPWGAEGKPGLVARLARFAGLRFAARTLSRLGPTGAIWPVREALRTLLLGRLFERYLDLLRETRAIRIDADEARRLRRAIDGALARALTVDVEPTVERAAIDDQRDALTALLDGLLSVAAGLPDRVVRRVDTAFDELVAGDA